MIISKIFTNLNIKLIKLLAKNSKRKDLDLNNIKRVLFLTYDKIGDMLITTPVFRRLKQKYSDIKIDIFASSRNKIILKYNPFVNKVYEYNNEFDKSLIKNFYTLLKARKEKYDLVVDFWRDISLEKIFKIKVIKAKFNVSPYKLGYFEKKYNIKTNNLKIYDEFFGTRKNKHFSKHHIDVLKLFDIELSENIYYDFYYKNEGKSKMDKVISKKEDDNLICLNIQSRTEKRTISNKKTKKLVNKILKETESKIIVISKDKNLKFLNELKSKYKDRVIIYNDFKNILEIGSLFEKIDLLITPDTSLVHIASAMKIPTVGIYSPNKGNFKRFKAVHDNFKAVYGKNNHINSIENFSIEKVLKLIISLNIK